MTPADLDALERDALRDAPRCAACGALATEVERAQTAERRAAELTAALRRYVPHCDTCGMVATWQEHEPDVDGVHECDTCHAAGEGDCVTEVPHAAVLRSLDGVSR